MQKEVGKTIGVLSLQGSVLEHINHIKALGHTGVEVKKKSDFLNLDALILPGGESTTIKNLLKVTGLDLEIIKLAKSNLPIWGTCAGLILLSTDIVDEGSGILNLLNVRVLRNAYGRQLDSFSKEVIIPSIDKEHAIPLVFIRAPFIKEVLSPNVEILLTLDSNIVAVREGNILGTSFHPELTNDLTFHKYFIDNFIH